MGSSSDVDLLFILSRPPGERKRQCVKKVSHIFVIFCCRTAATRKNSLSKFWQDNMTVWILVVKTAQMWLVCDKCWKQDSGTLKNITRMRKWWIRLQNRQIIEILQLKAFNPLLMREEIRFIWYDTIFILDISFDFLSDSFISLIFPFPHKEITCHC